MFKSKLVAVAVLAAFPLMAGAQSNIPVDPWVFYPDHPFTAKADTAPKAGRSATIPADPWVFYPPHPVAEKKSPAPAPSRARQIPVDPWVVTPGV